MRRSFRMTSMLFAALVSAAGAYAQTPAAPAIPKLSFDDAIQRALAKNPTVAQAATAILRAEGLLQQSRSDTLPSVYESLTNTTLNQAYGFAGGITQPRNQTTFGADLGIPVLAAAQWAATAQAREQVDIANLSVADVRRQVAVATAQAYLGVIAARRQVEVNARALDSAHTHLDYATKRLESGAGSRLNQLRAAQEVTGDEMRLENSRLALTSAQEALGVLVVGDGAIDAGDEPQFDVPATIDPATWTTARSDIRLFTAQRSAAERVVHDSGKDYWPTVSAHFDPQYVTPAGLFQPSKTWRFTVSVSQPVFDGGFRRAVARVRQAALDASTQALAGLELQARSEVRLNQASVQSYQRALESARLAAQQAADILRITTVAFEAGATTNLEVIDAQRSARDADTAAALAEDAVRKAQLELLVALGRFPK